MEGRSESTLIIVCLNWTRLLAVANSIHSRNSDITLSLTCRDSNSSISFSLRMMVTCTALSFVEEKNA